MAYRSIIATTVLAGAIAAPRQAFSQDLKGIDFFEAKVRPVLVEHCYSCHSAGIPAKKLEGGLLLDSRDGLLKGGDTGPAFVSGKPADSLLVKALRYDGDLKMPPKGRLPDTVIADIERWIGMGAPDPRTASAQR